MRHSSIVSGPALHLRFFALLLGIAVCSGCNRDSSDSESQSPPANASTDEREESQATPGDDIAADTSSGGASAGSESETQSPPASGANDAMPGAPSDQSPAGFPLTAQTPGAAGSPEIIGTPNGESTPGSRSLREDLTTAQLSKFLEDADRDMQLLASGRTQIKDPREASEMMKQLAKLKLQAAIRVQERDDATDKQQVDGMRGQLQALSHLAAMGDPASAKALESLAKDNLGSDQPTIASDSRIVLIGFAIDALRAGEQSAADDVVALIEGMKANPKPDVPAVLMMAEARQALAGYGLIDQAAKVRDKILTLYGNSSDPTIAKVAADAAGTAKFDTTGRLLAAILENENVALSRWTDAVMELTTEAPDMNTVQFLGTAALQLEAAGRNKFVEETFSILSEQFADQTSATATEVSTAKQAMEARRDVIGSNFDFADLKSVDGKGVPESHYQGKVVLMPFWAIVVPESLQIIRQLKEIRDQHPEQVAIVGMNLDPEQAPLREFLAQNELGFPSFRSVSSASQSVANPVAAEFGLVSMPFVAVFNQKGTVEALDFTGTQVGPIVDRLIGEQN